MYEYNMDKYQSWLIEANRTKDIETLVRNLKANSYWSELDQMVDSDKIIEDWDFDEIIMAIIEITSGLMTPDGGTITPESSSEDMVSLIKIYNTIPHRNFWEEHLLYLSEEHEEKLLELNAKFKMVSQNISEWVSYMEAQNPPEEQEENYFPGEQEEWEMYKDYSDPEISIYNPPQ